MNQEELEKSMTGFEQLYEDSVLPIRGTNHSAGYDLYSHQDVIVPGNGHILVKTGVACRLYPDQYLAIVPRSGLALKCGITVLNTPGTVDADYYPNEIGVILYNTNCIDFKINKGDRIAQGIVQSYRILDIDNVNNIRRDGGFGSTGGK